MINQFKWFDYNINKLLPSSWSEDIIEFSLKNKKKILLMPTSVTSREKNKLEKIESLIVNGKVIKKKLPWLYDLYRGLFWEYGQKCTNQKLYITNNSLYATNLNIQKGSQMRYECHVDSNPIQGLLYVTTHSKGSGGELVISNNENALGPKEIESDSEIIYPKSGHLVFFDARRNPHFVRPLKNKKDIRVVVAMNYYTDSSPETQRPNDLNKHLFGNINKGTLILNSF